MALRRIAVGLLAALVLVACARKTGSVQAPDFSLKDLSGKTVTLSSFRGHPVLLDYWATWCAPCQVSIPLVEQFYQRHKDQGVVVLGMNVDDDPSVVYPFVQRFHMNYPVLLAGDSDVPSSYRVDGVPSFYMLDGQGRLVQAFEGFSPAMPEAWEADLQRIMAAPH